VYDAANRLAFHSEIGQGRADNRFTFDGREIRQGLIGEHPAYPIRLYPFHQPVGATAVLVEQAAPRCGHHQDGGALSGQKTSQKLHEAFVGEVQILDHDHDRQSCGSKSFQRRGKLVDKI